MTFDSPFFEFAKDLPAAPVVERVGRKRRGFFAGRDSARRRSLWADWEEHVSKLLPMVEEKYAIRRSGTAIGVTLKLVLSGNPVTVVY